MTELTLLQKIKFFLGIHEYKKYNGTKYNGYKQCMLCSKLKK